MASTKEMTTTKRKFTAADIEKDCPDRLQQMGKQIAARLEKIDKQIVQAENHSISVNQLITQAKELCDEGGFNAFRDKFFPSLGKSRVYELLAIETGKKTVEEARASNRKRQAKHRANKAEAPNSVTVTENLELEPQVAPEVHREIDAPSIASEQAPEPTKPRSSDGPSGSGLKEFNSYVTELRHKISKHKVEHFLPTTVSADDLAKVGKFLSDLAVAKRSFCDSLQEKLTKPKTPKTIERELTIEDAISEALGEITTLAEEMREAFDNMPESLQSSAVGEARSEAADNLENISEPDVPAELRGDKFNVKWTVRVLSPSAERKQSRASRRDEATEILTQIVVRLEELADGDSQIEAQVKEAASVFVDEVQQIIDEAEAVEFPGMFG
jgi:hypothetical protein